MPATLSENERKNNTIRFINAARELIDSEGLDHISIRKIAQKAGFHNSTIYLYFKDVNQLIQLASLKHFRAYSRELSQLSHTKASTKETFYSVWLFFCRTVFAKPQIFYNFFFGKYSNDLTELIKEYYLLFPEEQEEYTQEIQQMFYAKNISERCLLFLRPMIGENDSRVTEENLELINEIIVSCIKTLLESKCSDPETAADDYIRKMMEMLHYIIEK